MPVPRLAGPVETDGVLDEPLWRDALMIELPLEVEPAENIAARVHTEVLLAYDDRDFHVAFRCLDPEPRLIRVLSGRHQQATVGAMPLGLHERTRHSRESLRRTQDRIRF